MFANDERLTHRGGYAVASGDPEWFVGIRVVDKCAGRKAADVDDEFFVVRALDETGFSRDRFSVGKVFGRVISDR